MYHATFHLLDQKALDQAQVELEQLGLQHFYELEDVESNTLILGGYFDFLPTFHHLIYSKYIQHCVADIDWKAQWTDHAPHFDGTTTNIPLAGFFSESKLTLTMIPGAGFGDLSHPTTRLMLELLGKLNRDSHVLDMGCGSAILSLAAALQGWDKVTAIDIDQEALNHAQINISLNPVEEKILLKDHLIPADISQTMLILFNMIPSDQEKVFATYPWFKTIPARWLLSGILEEKKDEYLRNLPIENFVVEQIISQDGWIVIEGISY